MRILMMVMAISVATPALTQEAIDRAIYVISDLHMGLGYADEENGIWHATEDFRWPNALRGFLEAITSDGKGPVDLVIAGDFLELWQPPASIPCKGRGANYGCTVAELRQLTELIVEAHSREFSDLAAFARADGGNCIHVVPGNHDAALLIPSVWKVVAKALGAKDGCVTHAPQGVWISKDGYVFSEHGHQIGRDANRYKRWPKVTKAFDGVEYLERPWGERFVQKLFNEEEKEYPLIDNLKPKSAGVRYRSADRGISGTLADFASFLRFNLLATSWRQKAGVLGKADPDKVEWDVKKGRDLGHLLYAYSLLVGDPMREKLLSGSDSWASLRQELDRLAQDEEWLKDWEVEALCDHLLTQKAPEQCEETTMGAGIERILFSRARVIRKHLEKRSAEHASMRLFAYGHTHAFEKRWESDLSDSTVLTVLNSGAFQRLVDDMGLRAIACDKGLRPAEVLEKVELDELPACYTFVEVEKSEGVYDARVRAWIMDENAQQGRFSDPCSSDCPNVGQGCDVDD